MATVGFADLPVPGGGDAPAGPGEFAALALAVDRGLIQHVADKAERDSVYAEAPLHTAVSAEDGSLWIKTAAATSTWATVYEPVPAWRPFNLAAGMVTGNVQLGVRRMGALVHIKGQIAKEDGKPLNAAYAVNLGTVPSDCVPTGLRTYPASCSLGGDTIQAVGRIDVLGSNTSSSYGTAGDLLWWLQDPAGTQYVDVTGLYWMD